MASAVLCTTQPPIPGSGTLEITPHDQYGSSIGVLGCKIDVNRVAYWPHEPRCDDPCVKISLGERSTYVLHIDRSEAAYDVSYEVYNYLLTGNSATKDPMSGHKIPMEYEFVDMRHCADLLDGGKLPLSAANSMNYLSKCFSEGNNWAAENHVLYNIADSRCTTGVDEVCTLSWPEENQADCPHGLGNQAETHGLSVVDTEYGTGSEAV
jgi:hypothetical protein